MWPWSSLVFNWPVIIFIFFHKVKFLKNYEKKEKKVIFECFNHQESKKEKVII
jgi:hypothetical protein